MKAPMRNSFVAAVAALPLVPAAAPADTATFGSSLQGTPDILDSGHQADTLFFNVSPQNSHKSPVSGQILEVRVKGAIVPKGPGKQDLNLFHIQVLKDTPTAPTPSTPRRRGSNSRWAAASTRS